MKTTPIMLTFTGGELSPYLDGRVDIQGYFNGAKTMENFIPLPWGGVMRRPGTYYVAETKTSAKASRLISFQFSTTQSYILEFGDKYIRFYKDGGQIIDGASPYEIVSPYAEADLFDLQFAQSADIMYIVHPSYKPQKLTRTGHTAWTIGNYTPTADPFTGADDYPSCVTIYEQRLVFGNTNNDPQKVWASVSGDYEDLTIGSGDADAYSYVIGSDQVNAIRWFSPGKVLLMGTLGAIFSMSSGSSNEGVTPTNVVVKRESTYGTIGVLPKKIGNFVYYLQRNAKILREIGYSYAEDEYLANEISVMSEHITGDGIVDMDYQQAPFNMLWMVRDDGEICTLTRQTEQKVAGWARQTTGKIDGRLFGKFESVAVIPGDGGDDEVWFIVRRYINGSWVRYVEYLKPFDYGDEQEDGFFVDCGLTLDTAVTITGATQAYPVVITAAGHGLSGGEDIIIRGVVGMTELNGKKFIAANISGNTFELRDLDNNEIDGTSYEAYESGGEFRELSDTLSGLDHLEDETVAICGDGAAVNDELVVSGAVTLDTASGEVHAGLPYDSILQTMRIESGGQLGTAQTKSKHIAEVYVRFWNSVGCNVGTPDNQDAISFRNTGDSTDEAIPLFTGDKRIPFPGDWDSDAYIYITQDQPLPLNILAIIPYLTTEER